MDCILIFRSVNYNLNFKQLFCHYDHIFFPALSVRQNVVQQVNFYNIFCNIFCLKKMDYRGKFYSFRIRELKISCVSELKEFLKFSSFVSSLDSNPPLIKSTVFITSYHKQIFILSFNIINSKNRFLNILNRNFFHKIQFDIK